MGTACWIEASYETLLLIAELDRGGLFSGAADGDRRSSFIELQVEIGQVQAEGIGLAPGWRSGYGSPGA